MSSPAYEANGTANAPEKMERMSASRYLATRLPTLRPPMHRVPNPFTLLGLLSARQWLFFLVGFLGWTVYIHMRFLPPRCEDGRGDDEANEPL